MDVLHSRCAGLDVHKKTVMVCVRVFEEGKLKKEVRGFSTMTHDILLMADWMAEHGVTHVAMESTGVFWKPIYNLLEGRFEILLCNAHHVKQVPGRKTDVKDCEWLAQLLQHGLLRGSFIPAKPIRDIRDLTRHRAAVVGDRSAVVNRIQKVLEDANVKLSSVASNVVGVSGRSMLEAIIEGESDPKRLAQLARRKLRGKIPQLAVALEGRITDHHRFMLKTLLGQVTYLDGVIDALTCRIEEVMLQANVGLISKAGRVPFDEAVRLLRTIPGIEERAAQVIVGEIGTDMTRFPSAAHLASWAGMCPGNHESAGKRRSGKTTKGSRWLQRTLTQASWAAGRTRNTYLAALYHRLAARRGKKRAVVAVGHTILTAAYYMLRDRKEYIDLGASHFDNLNAARLTRHLVRRLQSLGHKVTLENVA